MIDDGCKCATRAVLFILLIDPNRGWRKKIKKIIKHTKNKRKKISPNHIIAGKNLLYE
jgi:hypothetical protein